MLHILNISEKNEKHWRYSWNHYILIILCCCTVKHNSHIFSDTVARILLQICDCWLNNLLYYTYFCQRHYSEGVCLFIRPNVTRFPTWRYINYLNSRKPLLIDNCSVFNNYWILSSWERLVPLYFCLTAYSKISVSPNDNPESWYFIYICKTFPLIDPGIVWRDMRQYGYLAVTMLV